MADELLKQWPVEQIPDDDFLFMRIHADFLKCGDPIGAYQDRKGGMSTDWDRYSTAQEARNRAKNPKMNGIVRLHVKKVRELEDMLVEHAPLPLNRAHSEVFGEKTPQIRLMLNRMAEWVIRLED